MTNLKAWQLLQENGWCQGKYYDANGRYCVVGAISYVYSDDLENASCIAEKLRKRLGCWELSEWNDEPGRTQEEVVALLKELDI